MTTNESAPIDLTAEALRAFDDIGAPDVLVPAQERGVRWTLAHGVDSYSFFRGVSIGVGHHALVRQIQREMPARVSCNVPDLRRDLREAKEQEVQQVYQSMAAHINILNHNGRIIEPVDGLTGNPPSWGNVIRITLLG